MCHFIADLDVSVYFVLRRCRDVITIVMHGIAREAISQSLKLSQWPTVAVSSAEDPEKILEQAVEEMQNDLIKMRQASAQVLAQPACSACLSCLCLLSTVLHVFCVSLMARHGDQVMASLKQMDNKCKNAQATAVSAACTPA